MVSRPYIAHPITTPLCPAMSLSSLPAPLPGMVTSSSRASSFPSGHREESYADALHRVKHSPSQVSQLLNALQKRHTDTGLLSLLLLLASHSFDLSHDHWCLLAVYHGPSTFILSPGWHKQ